MAMAYLLYFREDFGELLYDLTSYLGNSMLALLKCQKLNIAQDCLSMLAGVYKISIK